VAAGTELARAFESAGVLGCVGHIERYNPALQSLRDRLENGDLGEVYQVATRRQGPFPERIRDVGVVKDLGTHDIDLTAWVARSPYRSVSASVAHRAGRPYEDLVAFVGHTYIHSIPTSRNDLTLIGLLAAVGLTLGVTSGFATHVRAGENGNAVARVGWVAGLLLVFGITARMAFAFAVTHGAHHAVASFSIAHQITTAAWPVALVSMAVCEVTARIGTVQLRGRRVMTEQASGATVIAGAA